LERTERALDALGDPHRAYPTLHIGGTNGKGSVASTLAAVLQRSRRTACYTSPHLCSFRERLLIDARPLTEEALLQYADEVRDPVVRFGLTFFEAATVLAMHAFARERVAFAVMEVGLGGRLDATNVVKPEVTAVTNVALDHADYLGATLPEIAREKAGIMKPGVPFVTAEHTADIVGLFRDLARDAGAPLSHFDPTTLRDVEVAADHTAFGMTTRSWGALDIRTPLVGLHQAANAGLAVEVLEQLGDDFKPDARDILRGIAGVEYHGRDEITLIDGCTWLFDVAHNTAGIHSLVDTIDRLELPRPLVALVGVLGDKDWKSMLPQLLSRVDVALLTQPPSAPPERRWDPDRAADEVEAITVVRVVEDFVHALDNARARAGEGTVVVTGSVHTVGSAMKLLDMDPLGE
jgi:dihydrofolate synthase/folylpolyglutamate synthase